MQHFSAVNSLVQKRGPVEPTEPQMSAFWQQQISTAKKQTRLGEESLLILL